MVVLKNTEINNKAGRRLAQAQVNQLKDAIGLLLGVAGYVNYEDEVDQLFDEVEDENKAATTRDDLARIAQQKPSAKPSTSGGRGAAKWTAGVGETIIGNLARGAGGRFVSATNIAKMTNLLNAENISPDMFEAMQLLIDGGKVSDAMLAQLQAAGLASDVGIATGKAADILTAMKTGNPDNLKGVFKGGGKGSGKGKKPPKPPKEQIQAENVDKIGATLIEQGRLTEQQLNALKMFALGENVDPSLMQELVNLGIVEVDENDYFSFTMSGNQMFTAMEKDDLRKALDKLNAGESKVAEQIEKERLEEQESLDEENRIKDEEQRIEEMKGEFVNRSGFPEIDEFIKFVDGEEVGFDFTGLGLTELGVEGKPITTKLGKKLADAIKKGKLRDALDAYREAVVEIEADEEQKIFADDGNEKCFGFKVLQGGDATYLLTWTTNAYEDREGETFTLKSLQNYVNENEGNSEKGTYQFWHTDGSDFADIIAQMVTGKFLVELGKFRKDDIGEAFKEFFLKHPVKHDELAPNGWGCSHGFIYHKADREDGIYEWFDKQETTILPLDEAANVFTLMEVL